MVSRCSTIRPDNSRRSPSNQPSRIVPVARSGAIASSRNRKSATVTGARLAQLWNIVDALVLLGLIPMLFWAQGIYQYILGTDLGR